MDLNASVDASQASNKSFSDEDLRSFDNLSIDVNAITQEREQKDAETGEDSLSILSRNIPPTSKDTSHSDSHEASYAKSLGSFEEEGTPYKFNLDDSAMENSDAFPLNAPTEGMEPEAKSLDSPSARAQEAYNDEEDEKETKEMSANESKEESDTSPVKKPEEQEIMESSPIIEAKIQEAEEEHDQELKHEENEEKKEEEEVRADKQEEPVVADMSTKVETSSEPSTFQIENDFPLVLDSADSPVSLKNTLSKPLESSALTGLTLKQMREQLEASEKQKQQQPIEVTSKVVVESSSKIPVVVKETRTSLDTNTITTRYSVSTLFPVVYEEIPRSSSQVKKKQQPSEIPVAPLASAPVSFPPAPPPPTKKSSVSAEVPKKKKTSKPIVSPPPAPITKQQLKASSQKQQQKHEDEKRLYQKEIFSLEKRIQSSAKQSEVSNTKYKLQFELLEKEKKLLTERLTRMKKQLDHLTKEHQLTKEELSKLKAENEIYHKTMPHLEIQLLKESKEADEKSYESNQLIVESHQMKARLQVLTTRNASLETQLKQLHDLLRTSQKDLRHKNFVLSQLEIKKKEQEQEKIEQNLKKKEHHLQLNDKISKISQNFQKKQLDFEKLRTQLQELTQEKNTLTLQNQKFQKQNVLLEQEVKQLRAMKSQQFQKQQQPSSSRSIFSTKHTTTATRKPPQEEDKKACTSCRILAKKNGELEQELLEMKQENLRLRQLHTQELQAQTKAYQQALLS